MVRAVRIAREKLDDVEDDVVRTFLMKSMAGMTVARLGVFREKNKVASLKTWTK